MADIELVIKIPEGAYVHLRNGGSIGASLMIENAIKNGTPLPQNATNGDVITAMFPNIEHSGSRGDADFYLLDGKAFNTPKLIAFKSWWNAPYKAEKQTPKRTLYPLVTHYSFDSEVPVWLFDTEEEAVAELRRQFEEEKRIELEENERTEGKDIFFKISDDGTYASITHVIGGNEPDDVTEWTVGDLKN